MEEGGRGLLRRIADRQAGKGGRHRRIADRRAREEGKIKGSAAGSPVVATREGTASSDRRQTSREGRTAPSDRRPSCS